MADAIKKVGIIVKQRDDESLGAAGEIAEWLSARGIEVHTEERFEGKIKGAVTTSRKEMSGLVEMIIVLGGDGTVLHAARLVGGTGVPLLGVNLGSLGFLTAVNTVEELLGPLEEVIKGGYELDERMMLSVGLDRGGENLSDDAFNDIVIKGTRARLIKLEVRIDKKYVTTYRADGLIVATPTGSTAYALSAAGPILYPSIHSIIVVPICPFNLTNRPVIIPDWMTVEVSLVSEHGGVMMTLDGQIEMPLAHGDVLEIKRSEKDVQFVKCGEKGYFDILRERLMWEGAEKKK